MPKRFYWLMRIINKSEIKNIQKGFFSLSKVEYWIASGTGQNDIHEGCMSIEASNAPRTYTDCKNYPRGQYLKEYDYNGERIIRDERINNINALSCYGIEAVNDRFVISSDYFKDFTNANRNDYFMLVIEANSFEKALRKAVTDFGFEEKDLFSKSIVYIEKGIGFKCYEMFPYELFYKDKTKYYHQQEYRFVVTSKDMKLQNKLSKEHKIKIDLSGVLLDYFAIPNDGECIEVTTKDNKLILNTINK